jgi:hypothetical protein
MRRNNKRNFKNAHFQGLTPFRRPQKITTKIRVMKYIKQLCAILAFSAVGLAQEAPDQSLNNGTPIFTAKATIKIKKLKSN